MTGPVMVSARFGLGGRLFLLCTVLLFVLAAVVLLGLGAGSSGVDLREAWIALVGQGESIEQTIVRRIRLPRVILAGAVGATLALGGLVFQALLRNPLAEPYILGVSGGAAVGAICGMFLGLAPFPGVSLAAFGGSMVVLALIILVAGGQVSFRQDSLLLGGVMMNAFCGAIIMFLLAISQSTQAQKVLFWLMGDLSMITADRLPLLLSVLPCFIIILALARPMNLLLLGAESASVLGINVRLISLLLLATTSFMVSIVVSLSGLVGFVGLVIPHIFRLILGSDHRLLIPACLLGGASYLIGCDLLARLLSVGGELPVGIITALIGAPLFVFLLWRSGP